MRSLKLTLTVIVVTLMSFSAFSQDAEFKKTTEKAYKAVVKNLSLKSGRTHNYLVKREGSKLIFEVELIRDNLSHKGSISFNKEEKASLKGLCFGLFRLIYVTESDREIFKKNKFTFVKFSIKAVDKFYNEKSVDFRILPKSIYDLGDEFFESSFVKELF